MLTSDFESMLRKGSPEHCAQPHRPESPRQLGVAENGERRQIVIQELFVVLVAAVIFLGTAIGPPSLMDDVDAVQAQIARNMLDSGDWVTARLNGVKYLEKPPLKYWCIAAAFAIFGVHDWAARLPIALSAIALCWLTLRIGRWAWSPEAGFYAGLGLATCVGLFLFTRVLIADVMLTVSVTLALWAFLRCLDPEERRSRLWSAIMAVSIGWGLLLKGLIAGVFSLGIALVYLAVTRRLFDRVVWRRLHLVQSGVILFAVAAPWHALAIVRNPPYFDLTMKSEPGTFRGFFWFYFLNEHVFRFLNMRYPRDYNTVPRLQFWLLHLLWLFPWSLFLPAALKRPEEGRGLRMLALCWIGFVLIFFTFSTTQEYYSMPAYPAFALLIGGGVARGGRWIGRGILAAGVIAAAAFSATAAILWMVRSLPTPGDISQALTLNPDAYTLSLGHMGDLTLASFAYLRCPLALAAVAFAVGAAGAFSLVGKLRLIAIASMMVVLFHAARVAMLAFDPYLSSRPLAEALNAAPPGKLIVDNQYYAFSSVFFYSNTGALLLNGRVNNLEYGSHEPGAPAVFITDPDLSPLWSGPERYYLLIGGPALGRVEGLLGANRIEVVKAAGGKFLLSNGSRGNP
jgi:4-amino-4-deoxy-L-arabinose transferase-like glycosyltransferase